MELFMVLSLLGVACAISLAKAAIVVRQGACERKRERVEARTALEKALIPFSMDYTNKVPLPHFEEYPETRWHTPQISMSPAETPANRDRYAI